MVLLFQESKNEVYVYCFVWVFVCFLDFRKVFWFRIGFKKKKKTPIAQIIPGNSGTLFCFHMDGKKINKSNFLSY